MRRGGSCLALAAALAGALGVACASEDADVDSSEGAASVAAEESALIVTERGAMADLEKRGLSFAGVMGVKEGKELASGKALVDSKIYKGLVDAVKGDLADIHKGDPKSGVGFDFEHRMFDAKWLSSDESRFELVGVVNRTDARGPSDCGELHLVYRFAYTAKKTGGRLPMTVSLIFPQPSDNDGCATVAQRWLSTKSSASSLLDGPLKPIAGSAVGAALHGIDINYQAVQWSQESRPDFGGESDYILRSFTVEKDALKAAPLENTPRTDLKSAERDELQKWVTDNLDAIDNGTAQVPAKFLADRATSVGPYGIARLANRPFSQIFAGADADKRFKGLPLARTKQLASVAALMRRLDTMTCQGCHHARAVAGFHLLGEERDANTRLNALTVGRSPHLQEELGWRMDALDATAKKKPVDPRPFAEHASRDSALGTHCGLGDPGFKSWTCGSGLQCLDIHGDVVGVCAQGGAVGDACVTSKITLDDDSHKDKMSKKKSGECKGANAACQDGAALPDGLCTEECKQLGKVTGAKICGAVPEQEKNFNCMIKEKRPFPECVKEASDIIASLRACDAKTPCRDDWACMRVDKGPVETGACMPPYFAFQVRVDGHMFD